MSVSRRGEGPKRVINTPAARTLLFMSDLEPRRLRRPALARPRLAVRLLCRVLSVERSHGIHPGRTRSGACAVYGAPDLRLAAGRG